jgi:hypothetical protein
MPRIPDVLERESRTVDLEPGDFERLLNRRERKERNRRIRAAAVAILVVVVVAGALMWPFSSNVVPAAGSPEPNPTTEHGSPIGVSSISPDGEVTLSAPSGWGMHWFDPEPAPDAVAPDVWFGVLWPGPAGDDVESVGLVDPVAYDAWCAAIGGSPLLSAPADAAEIAQQVIDDPNFETTSPVAARVGGVEAVSIDAKLAPGGSPCGVYAILISRWIHGLVDPGMRLRLYLVDLPEGMSVRTLAITVTAPKESFEKFIEETAPIIESIEFHPRVGTTSASAAP